MQTHQALRKKSSPPKSNASTANPLTSRPFAVQPKLEETERSPAPRRCESTLSDFAILNPERGRSMPVQPKLTLSPSGDKYEQKEKLLQGKFDAVQGVSSLEQEARLQGKFNADARKTEQAKAAEISAGGVLQEKGRWDFLTPSLVKHHPAPPQVQRQIFVGPEGKRANVLDLLPKLGIEPKDWSRWFTSKIKPSLSSRYAYTRFQGFLTNASGNYDIAADTSTDPTTLNYDAVSDAVVRAFNIHFMQKRMASSSRGLGKYKAIAREGFPSLIKKAFDKTAVMKITDMTSKNIHLRHFVMGSWFRLLPDIFKKAKLTPSESDDLTKRIAKLIPQLGVYSGVPNAAAAGKLNTDIEILATLLHDLEPNLNAGEGPENSLIGFLSHGFSELAVEIQKDGNTFNREDVPELIHTALDAINLVSKEERTKWAADFGPVDVFEALLQNTIGDTDPAPPDEMSKVMHLFAYQLGMDFMKRPEGLSADLQKHKIDTIARVQSLLVSVGEKLYAIIAKGQTADIDATDLVKLVNDFETLAGGLESSFPRKK